MKNLKNKNKNNKKGITLIVVTSIMLVLSTTAVTFVRIAGYERTAATNYAETVNAKLAAYAGIDHAVGLLHENVRTKGRLAIGEVPSENGPGDQVVIQYPADSDPDVAEASQRTEGNNPERISLQLLNDNGSPFDLFNNGGNEPFAVSGFVGRRLGNDIESNNILGSSSELHSNFYSLKIEDNAGKFNVNSHVAFNEDLATVNATNQAFSNIIFSRIIRSLAAICFVTTNDAQIVNDIVELIVVTNTPNNVGIRFENDRILEEQLRTIPGFTGDNAIRFLSNVTTNSFIDRQTFGVLIEAGRIMDLDDAPRFYREGRSPVNINTASVELLTALIENIKGRGSFYVNEANTIPDVTFVASGGDAFQTESKLVNAIAAFEIGFSRTEAQQIATQISTLVGTDPFVDQGEIEEFFVEGLANPIERPRLGEAFNADFINALTDNLDNNSFAISEEAWDQAVKDTLRSNFNPNVIDNFWNPNAPAYRRVCKGELVDTEVVSSTISMTASHTTELTAFSVGSVNITSVGRVTSQQAQLVTGISTISTTANFGNQRTLTTQEQLATQQQLSQDNGVIAQTMTSPNNLRLQRMREVSKLPGFANFSPNRLRTELINFNINGLVPDRQAGAVEPATIVALPTGTEVDDNDVLFFSRTSFANENFNIGDQLNSTSTDPDDFVLDLDNGRYKAPLQWLHDDKTDGVEDGDGVNNVKKITYPVNSNGVVQASSGLPDIMRASNLVRNNFNNVAFDGLVSRKAFYSKLSAPGRERYFIETAFESIFNSGNTVDNYLAEGNRNDRNPELRDDNVITGVSKIGNISGSLQFWVKFDADTLDTLEPFNLDADISRTTFGLIGVTTASGFRIGQAFGQAGGEIFVDTRFREGAQMYVYMNSLGELRVSRLYYALCFKIGGTEPYGAMFESDVDAENRKTARKDIIFETNQQFQAHEWYHIQVDWDDSDQREGGLNLTINNDDLVRKGRINFEFVDDNSIDVEYCLLNEEEPLDAFYINGFPRAQAKLGGYFHFDENVHFVGNATIDDVISSTTRDFGSEAFARKRFNEFVTYENSITAEPGDDILAAIRWTSYPPYRGDDLEDNDQDQPRVRLLQFAINGQPLSGNIAEQNIASENGQPREVAVVKDILEDFGQSSTLANLNAGIDIQFQFEFDSPPPLFITDGRNTQTPSDEEKKFFQGASCATLDSITIVTLKNFPDLENTIIQ